MHIQFARDASSRFEYGCDLRRIYPWAGVVDPLWGSAIASVQPSEATTPDCHDEHETFVVTSGRGEVLVEDEVVSVLRGDVVYVPPNQRHVLRNTSDDECFEFISIFWGSPEANERMFALTDQMRAQRVAP